jgi:hypothetical protein
MADTPNLPDPVHNREQGTALAVPQAPTGFEIGGEDIRPPRLKICQDPKTQNAEFGDVFVQTSKDDPSPVIVQKNKGLGKGELSEPLRFYAHASRRGVNFYMPEHPDAGFNGMVLGPWHTTVAQFLATFPHAIDPTKVYRKYDFVLTVPEYPELPVQLLLASSAGGAAAAELNKLIRMLQNKGQDPTEVPFQLQIRSTQNAKGTFFKSFIGLGQVDAATVAADQEIVQEHALLLPNARLVDEDASNEPVQATDAPDLS